MKAKICAKFFTLLNCNFHQSEAILLRKERIKLIYANVWIVILEALLAWHASMCLLQTRASSIDCVVRPKWDCSRKSSDVGKVH